MGRVYIFLSIGILSIGLGVFSSGLVSADISIPAGVGMSEPIYFMTPGGEPIQVPAGLYHVDTAEYWLELSPIGGTRVDAIVIEATTVSHEETLSTERAFLMPVSTEHPELKSLVLYRPDGTAYEAVGSQTGIWSRGLKSMFNHARKKMRPAAKVTRKVSKDVLRHAQRTGKQVYKRIKRAKAQKKVLKRIMKSKDESVDAVVKMMNAMFSTQQKVMRGGMEKGVTSRGLTPKLTVEQCTAAAKTAMTQDRGE